MNHADVSAALDGALRDEELLLGTFPTLPRDPGRGGAVPPTPARAEEVTCCYACGGAVGVVGALHEEGGLDLLAVWWCAACRLAFDDAGIAAPERGRAPLTPGYNWYGRWRFRPAP
jgi:hypothetical protein